MNNCKIASWPECAARHLHVYQLYKDKVESCYQMYGRYISTYWVHLESTTRHKTAAYYRRQPAQESP